VGSPKRNRPSPSAAVSVFPNALKVGDRFTNEDGEWEIASRPVTYKQGQRFVSASNALGRKPARLPQLEAPPA